MCSYNNNNNNGKDNVLNLIRYLPNDLNCTSYTSVNQHNNPSTL